MAVACVEASLTDSGVQAVSDFVIFTDQTKNRVEDFDNDKFFSVDAGLGIKYDTKEVYEESLLLLRYNCPESTCDVACLGWPDLHRHVRNVHRKAMWYERKSLTSGL